MKKNIIIFGSNFGSIVHIKAINKLKNFLKISICSPNIYKKKLNLNNIKRFDNYKKALRNNFDAVGIVATPAIQSEICNYIIKNMKKIKYILLEKPIAPNFNDTKKIIKRLIKKKINFIVNFIFENIPAFKQLSKILKKKQIIYAKYEWKFKQMYFKNKIKTWKTNYKDGGGLVNYYLIHIFYNLYLFFNKLKIVKIVKLVKIKDAKNKKLLTYINLLIESSNGTKISVTMDINSNKNEHSLLFVTEKETYSLINKSKDWVKNFSIYKNKKKINFKNKKFNREILTAQNYTKLFMSKCLKSEKIERITNSHKLCDEIIKKIYN
jgi:predicted dehydrogenase